MTKKYRVSIDFFFNANDEGEALGIADNIANNVEKEYNALESFDLEAKVNEPEEAQN